MDAIYVGAAQVHAQNLQDRLCLAHGQGENFSPLSERQVFVNAVYELR